jgi:hypothetical protein
MIPNINTIRNSIDDAYIFFGRPIYFAAALAFIISIGIFQVSAQSKKLSPQEIISKHLASIGSAEILTASKRRMVIAGSEFIIRSNAAKATGRAVLASDGENMALFSTFNMSDYKMERIGNFSNKIEIPFVIPGRRSPLGSWLTAYDRTLDDRVFGGSIFSTWLFYGPEGAWGEIETEGKKKVGDRDAWVIRYSPKKGLKGGSYVRLYFDAENFHHLRTVYRQGETESGFYDTGTRGSNRGNTGRDWDASMANNGSILTEDFSDYHEDAGLVLPHQYSINLKIDSSSGTAEYDWKFHVEEYRLIKQFPVNFFSFNKDALP